LRDLSRAAGFAAAGVGVSWLRKRERERERKGEREGGKKRDGTHMDRRIGKEGNDERREGWKRGIERTDVYLAFAVPARHLVSCPPSLPPTLPPFLPSFLRPSSLLSPPALSSLTERRERARARACDSSVRVGAGVASEDARGKARERRESVTRSWGCWVGVDHGPPCPRRLEGRPRHRGRRKGGRQARGAEG